MSARNRSYLIVIACMWAGAIILIFGGYELAERLWVHKEDMDLIHVLHIIRGVMASGVTVLLVVVYLAKVRPVTTIFGGPLSYLPVPDVDAVRRRAIWFVQMRWIAIILATFVLFISYQLNEMLPRKNFPILFICLLVLFITNLFYWYYSSRTSEPYRLIVTQIIGDLILLTLVLHFSGGLENPIYLFYIFHVIIAGIVLSKRDAILITVLTFSLFIGLVSAELFGLVPHYYIGLFPHGEFETFHVSHDLIFVLGRVITFLLVLVFAGYFTILLREQNRREEANIVQAGKLAAIGELAGRIAHEINNPIGIISTKTKLLLERSGLSDKVVSDLSKIDKHSFRIAELTNGLLTFCRPSLGEKSPLNLNEVIESSLPLIELGRSGGKIQIEKDLEPSLPLMMGNVNELQQITLNIVNNAIDAMTGGGMLKIQTRIEKGTLLLSIADTGSAIHKKNIDRIFDPFFTTKEVGKGTGLGLSITHGLVQSHKGVIEVVSKKGMGTKFILKFPIIPAKEGLIHGEG